MPKQKRDRSAITERLLPVIIVAACFFIFVAVDQMHWWSMKSDYSFGWLVPVFVAYVIYDRWSRLRKIVSGIEPGVSSGMASRLLPVAVGAVLVLGLLAFLFGALYRAGLGASQPGSLALAVGVALVVPAMIFFSIPTGAIEGQAGRGFACLKDTRLQLAALFLFPSVIWILSAPLLSAVENAVSLFLLRRVVAVVFALFSALGLPLVQQGSTLILPHGQVGVEDACSGIRSLMACLFAGSFLAAVFLDRFWKKTLLIVCALVLAFFTNLLRSIFLTAWAYCYGSDAIHGAFHDATGYAVLGLTTLLLFCLLPFFNGANWRRWLGFALTPGACIQKKNTKATTLVV